MFVCQLFINCVSQYYVLSRVCLSDSTQPVYTSVFVLQNTHVCPSMFKLYLITNYSFRNQPLDVICCSYRCLFMITLGRYYKFRMYSPCTITRLLVHTSQIQFYNNFTSFSTLIIQIIQLHNPTISVLPNIAYQHYCSVFSFCHFKGIVVKKRDLRKTIFFRP